MTYVSRSGTVLADDGRPKGGAIDLSPRSARWPVRLGAGVDGGSIFLTLSLTTPLLSVFMAGIGSAAGPTMAITSTWFPAATILALNAFLAAVAILCFAIDGQYRRLDALRERRRATAVILGVLVLVHLSIVEIGGLTLGSGAIIVGWGGACVAMLASRRAVHKFLAGNVGWLQPAVIVGPVELARRLAASIAGQLEATLRVTHIICTDGTRENGGPDEGQNDPAMKRVPPPPQEITAGTNIATDLVDRFGDHIVLVYPPADPIDDTTQRLLFLASSVNGRAGVVSPDPATKPGAFDGHTVLQDGTRLCWIRNRLGNPYWRLGKRLFDIVAAAMMLILLAPLFFMIALPGLFRGKGVIFGHLRIGRYGRPFTCYKFRTMVSESDKVLERLLATDDEARREWTQTYKLKNDPRVTPLGAVLRRTSLDELPQLWNVLKGDMSLVGPRPIVESELFYYGEEVVCYYSVRPGLTGLWQVSGRNDTTYDQRVALDISYIQGWSAWKDIGILIKTFFVVLYGTGAY